MQNEEAYKFVNLETNKIYTLIHRIDESYEYDYLEDSEGKINLATKILRKAQKLYDYVYNLEKDNIEEE